MLAFLAIALLAGQNPPPWKPPYEAVKKPESYARFADRLGTTNAGVFAAGDRLTFLAQGDDNPFALPDWLELSFVRDSVTGLWVAQARMKDAERAFFTYALKTGETKTSALFYGPKAPRAPHSAAPLLGTLKTVSFPSKNLGESREVAVYLPPHAAPGLNAIYMADGQSCEAFAKVLEPLILAGRVAPTAIVGLFHGPFKGDPAHYDFNQDFRAREYLKVLDADRFEAHLRFVAEEVVPWAEKEFGMTDGPSHRALFGFSNGAAFALVASAERPDVFGSVLPFSVAVFDRDGLAKTLKGRRLPRYWLAAGTLEPFVRATAEAERILKAGGASVHFERYVSGHDEAMWRMAFANVMPKVFPAR